MNTEDLVVTHMSAEQQQQHQQQQENQIEEVPEIATLPNYLKEWLILEDELKVLSNAVKEKKKRMGILQGLITKTMKGHKLARVNI
jgi:ATP-dependent protease Clp ATPase subunit